MYFGYGPDYEPFDEPKATDKAHPQDCLCLACRTVFSKKLLDFCHGRQDYR